MELDTGVAVSIVSESTFRRLWSGTVLERSGIRLCTYSGESLRVIGTWEEEGEVQEPNRYAVSNCVGGSRTVTFGYRLATAL